MHIDTLCNLIANYRNAIKLDEDFNRGFFILIKTISQKDSSNAIQFLLDKDIHSILMENLDLKNNGFERNFSLIIMIIGNLMSGEDRQTQVYKY